MCGIFFSCQQTDQDADCYSPEVLSKLNNFLKRRGPDALEELTFLKHDFMLKFIGSVLHLRGNEIVKQPITDCNNNTLLWNGEIFNCGIDNEDESDTLYLFNQLNECQKLGKSVYEVISNIRGPFTFVYWNEHEKSIYFGRDFIGRRSLCWKKVAEPFSLSLSSVCPPGLNDWEEVPASGIFRLDFNEKVPTLQLTEWNRDAFGGITKRNLY
uniref:Glutamine amidotransferase type-2 domain-containing protein n=1 Tax=Tetranychus urticae TaxID=32264 RepID=T1L0J9_TETUR